MKEIFTRANQYLLFAVLLVLIFYFGRTFIIPIISAALLAMLMAPLCRRFDRWGFHRALSSFICVFILLIVVLGILAIIGAQFAAFAEDVSLIEKKSKEMMVQAQTFIDERFGISPEKQEAAVKEQTKGAGKSAGRLIAGFFGSLTAAVAGMVITLVFTFLFIFSKEKYNAFFLKLYKDKDPDKVKEVVDKISDVAQKYLTGRAMSITIIAVLYAIGLSIVGIKNNFKLSFIT